MLFRSLLTCEYKNEYCGYDRNSDDAARDEVFLFLACAFDGGKCVSECHNRQVFRYGNTTVMNIISEYKHHGPFKGSLTGEGSEYGANVFKRNEMSAISLHFL